VKLGDFFKTAPHMRPVNPKPVTLTAVCKDLDVLPGGIPNNAKKQVAAQVKCCLVFIGAEGTEEARRDARRFVAESAFDPKAKVMLPIDADAVSAEIQKQILWRALREYDETTQFAGDQQFPTVTVLRNLVEHSECNRLMDMYDAYVKEEHPEAVNQQTF